MHMIKGSDLFNLFKSMAELERLANAGPEQSRRDRRDAKELLLRIEMGLSPIHDFHECVRVLFEEGREAFEKVRGEPSKNAHEWKP